MIKPDRYMDLDNSVLRISSIILKILIKKRMLDYDCLLNLLIKKEGEQIGEVYLNSLSFLYLLNKIEYHLDRDTIEIK